MAFPTDDILLGPATFGRRGDLGNGVTCAGIIWHTTEASGTSRAHAVGTANWQKSNPGSYNFIIYDGGILLTVPFLEASGGVNPASPAWAPGRFPWLKSMLPAKAYGDPNKYHLNVAFSGRTADFAAGKMPANMIDTAARLALWVEKQAWGADNLIFSGHMHWQSNRSDPSQRVIDDILKRYAEIVNPPAPPPPAPPPPDYKALYEGEKAKLVTATQTIATLKTKIANAVKALA